MNEARMYRYDILERGSREELAVAVEMALNDGWLLAGGVHVQSWFGREPSWIQAVWKDAGAAPPGWRSV
jgi:hypothetical protein